MLKHKLLIYIIIIKCKQVEGINNQIVYKSDVKKKIKCKNVKQKLFTIRKGMEVGKKYLEIVIFITMAFV